MDSFGDLFRGMRAQGSLFGSSTLSPPWALDFVDGAPLTLCAVISGAGWIVTEGQPPVQLRAGETAVVRGPAPFLFVEGILQNIDGVTSVKAEHVEPLPGQDVVVGSHDFR